MSTIQHVHREWAVGVHTTINKLEFAHKRISDCILINMPNQVIDTTFNGKRGSITFKGGSYYTIRMNLNGYLTVNYFSAYNVFISEVTKININHW